jgi:2-C-methyl-D-erythritol 4-phosphate cytidylyltransferase
MKFIKNRLILSRTVLQLLTRRISEEERMSTLYAVILAGGTGERLGGGTPKQFLDLGGKEMIRWSLDCFLSLEETGKLVVVIAEEWMEKMQAILDRVDTGDRPLRAVPGGATRRDSSRKGVDALEGNRDELVCIHDAARPFVTPEIVKRCAKGAGEYGAAAPYLPVTDTVALSDEEGFIREVPDRSSLYLAQTPQVFRYGLIREAHREAEERGITASDDVSLALESGHRVLRVEGDPANFKVTTSQDLERARWFIRKGQLA